MLQVDCTSDHHYLIHFQFTAGQKREDISPGPQALQPGAALQQLVVCGHHLRVQTGFSLHLLIVWHSITYPGRSHLAQPSLHVLYQVLVEPDQLTAHH